MKRPRVAVPFDAVVGVSVNSEFELVVKDTPGPKKELDISLCSCPSGSSGNADGAIRNLGGHSSLVGLVEVNYDKEEETLESLLLKRVVKQSGVSFTPVPVLSKTNIAAIPIIKGSNGQVWGKKGEIIHSEVSQALQILSGPEVGIGPKTFVVITGLRAVELPFAKALLSQAQKGYSVLNAKESFCKSREFKKILPLVDLLVLNQREFFSTGMCFSEIYDCGPTHMVMTDSDKGGMLYFGRGYYEKFAPVKFPNNNYETGAGDWFLGALVSELIRRKISTETMTLNKFRNVVAFAARVAGKKITMTGGGNGPSRHQLR
ncbi:MAG: carbohydrate kinase family protein [Candidatus Pacebacteria bacterium]|nr:carbohydrate kinase family protein [Candidatus Paceibacterota bacterium]